MTVTFAAPRIEKTVSPDGSIVVRSVEPLEECSRTVYDDFCAGAAAHADRVLVAEKSADGDWNRVTWGAMLVRVEALARGLVRARAADGRAADAPIMVLSHNSIAHMTVTLAAYAVGMPVVPVSVAYSLQSDDHAKLTSLVAQADPGVVFAESEDYRAALEAVAAGRTVLSATPIALDGATTIESFSVADGPLPPRPTLDSVGKIMFTSGSTGNPKGVLNTHRMMAVNQQQMRQVWPFLNEEPPILLDWLPWSHTFGGNHNMNMVLTNGGSLWIDDGRPAPTMIGRTVTNLRDVSPTVYFNVPAGYAALVPILERDPDAAKGFFADLRLAFYAAAALPQGIWDALAALADQYGGRAQMTTSWGMTETAPAATTTHFPTSSASSIGVPLPGVDAKLAPVGEKLELRVRGPNITPGFYGRPELLAEKLDEDGFLRTGDACRLIDDDDPRRGLCFDGRIAEDFKLATGTFVSVGTLRPQLLSACGGMVSDAVICGHDSDAVTALIWLHPDHAARQHDGVPDDDLRADLVQALGSLAVGAGSSQRVERLLILTEPAQLDAGELTDKGYVNQARVRARRTDLVAEIGAAEPGPRVVCRLSAYAGA
ncbi:AMP-binding protein [Gordonia hydrophobica]|uniref:AMP-binding protein n=1 Tax=Gordonia hydrophobica TaxID=40516 RepID=A0ABZ2U0G2_9ACTN|nr:AMP-binding protein [Gordonia hydrophobica]MBM7367003.1 feruloyl-CoA synthase [Gordonia hydrophobica]